MQDGAETLFLQRHRWRRSGRRAPRAASRLGNRRHARRRQQFSLRPGQLDLGHAGLQPLAAGGQRQAGARIPQRLLPLPARRQQSAASCRARIPPLHQQQHLGSGDQRRRTHLRLDGQPQPQRLSADSQPLLRARARLDAVARAGHDRRHAPVSSPSPTRFGRSTTTAATRPARATRSTPPGNIPRSIGIARRSSADRRGIWSARSCSIAEGSRLSLDQPVQSAGQRRRVDRADHGRGRVPTATCG